MSETTEPEKHASTMNPPDQSSTLPLSATQPTRETQSQLNQRSHQGAISDKGYTCSQSGLQQCINDLSACESERQRLTDENTALKARCEELERLVMAQLPPDGPQQALAGGKEENP